MKTTKLQGNKMFRIVAILIISSMAGSAVNCGSWLSCFGNGCLPEDVAPETSKQSATNSAVESSVADTAAKISAKIDTKIDNESEIPKQTTRNSEDKFVKTDVLSVPCKDIDTAKFASDSLHPIIVYRCMDEIASEIDNYKSSSFSNHIIDAAFDDMAIFDSLYDNVVSSEKKIGFGESLDIEQPRRSKLEAYCLEGELDINDDYLKAIKEHVSKQRASEMGRSNQNYYGQDDSDTIIDSLFSNTCVLIDKDEPLKKLLRTGEQFLIQCQRLVRGNQSPRKKSQCNVRLIRYLLCKRLKRWPRQGKRKGGRRPVGPIVPSEGKVDFSEYRAHFDDYDILDYIS